MLKSGKATFDTIITNILAISKLNIKIVIRISFDENNINEIENLLVYLKNAGLSQRVIIYFAPIHQTESQKDVACSYCSQNIFNGYSDIASLYCKLYNIANELNYRIPTCYTNGPCMVVAEDSCLISPSGDLFKCVEMIGNDSLCIGNIYDDNYNRIYCKFIEAQNLNECINKGCKFVPMCGGGCVMESYLARGNLNCVSCHYEIFEKVTSFLNILKCDKNGE